jgi:FtsP/CotA-like multicopper oxidase with cupredoxin domain
MEGVRSRGLLLAGTVVAAALAILLVLTLSTGRATSGGSPYDVPLVNDTNPDPNIVETTITAQAKTVEINTPIGTATDVHALTYNGTIPGPTFKLKVGDTVIVHFKNDLNEVTGIHWHGIELANSMDGTPFTQNQVPPGGTFLYKFKVNRPGLYWYHPHHHNSTNQVFKGMYGMIVVEDPNDAALRASGTLPSLADTRQLVLSDTTVCNGAGFNPSAVTGQKHAYDDNDDTTPSVTQPWSSMGPNALPKQAAPSPKDLCETAPLNDQGKPGTPFGSGDIPNIQTDTTNLTPANARTNEGVLVLTNGKNVGQRSGGPGPPPAGNPTPGAVLAGATKLDVLAGQGLRLQMLNSAAVRYMRLRLTKADGTLIPLIRVGGEGGLLNAAIQEGGVISSIDTKYEPGEILLPPGSRADVVAAIPTGGVGTDLTMWTEDFSRTGQGFSNTPTVPVMHLHVTGSAGSTFTIPPGKPLRNATGDPVENLALLPLQQPLNPAVFTPQKKGSVLTAVKLTQDTTNPRGLGVDNTFGTHETNGDYSDADHLQDSSRYMTEGSLLEYTVENTTNAHHPFHLHGFSIQPLTLTVGANTLAYPPEFRDNVDIPGSGELKFRVRIDPRPMPDGTTAGGALGRWVFHCHIFFHATNGMLSEFVVTNGSGNERPDVNVGGSDVAVNQGDTATINGTFKDRDGDPVTLSANVGAVTKTGGNNYSWSYPTGRDTSRFVYITATDSNGLKSQIPFFLTINNRSPSISVPGAQKVGTGNRLTFGVTGSDPDAVDPLSLSGLGLPAAMTFRDNGDRTGTASGRANAAPGDYNAIFSATDGIHTPASGSVKITIAPFAGVLDNPERLVRRKITVGCRFYSRSIRSCAGTVRRGRTRAGGASTLVRRTGRRSVSFKIQLTAATRRLVARSIPGVLVSVTFTGRKFGSRTTYRAVESTRVVAPTVVARPTFNAFAANSSALNSRATSYLNSVARQVGRARRITCTAHPDGSSTALARSRASAVCAALRAAGLTARFTSVGASRPRNKHIVITIQR